MSITIKLGDCRAGLREMHEQTIDCVVTSPPYKDCDDYTPELMHDVFTECYRVLTDDGLCFVNFGHLAEDKARPFDMVSILTGIGFKLSETFVWVKNHYRPIQGKRRVNNLTEFIFMFCKQTMPELDRLSIGVPYADKSNIGRYSDQDLKCAGNVWFIDYETITSKDQKMHNDRFPIELPSRCIKLSQAKRILDPFSGSGTTAIACQQLHRDFIGWEIDEGHHQVSVMRLQEDKVT